MTTLPRQHEVDYEPGDYLLIDKHGQIQGVSGNSEFWEDEETMPPVNPNGNFIIVKVLITQTVDDNGRHYAEYDYASEECPDCITRVNQPIPYEPGPNWRK